MSSNPYILNIVPLFNVADSATGGTDTTDLTATVSNLSNYFNVATNSLLIDGIQPYTTSGTITITGNVNVVGELDVNGAQVGQNTTTGINTITGSNILLETAGSLFNYSADGNAFYYTADSISTTTNFFVSSTTFRADRAAIGTNGTSALSTIFDVWNGNAYFDRSIFVRSNVQCQTVYQVSDERWKQNTKWLGGGALSTLVELRGMRYDMGGTARIGFLAQEVEKVLPEAVSKENPDAWMIDYSTFIPLIVEAMKELLNSHRYP